MRRACDADAAVDATGRRLLRRITDDHGAVRRRGSARACDTATIPTPRWATRHDNAMVLPARFAVGAAKNADLAAVRARVVGVRVVDDVGKRVRYAVGRVHERLHLANPKAPSPGNSWC